LDDGLLCLFANGSSLTKNVRPTFIGRRQESENILVETHLNFCESSPGDEAGLSVYQINDGHVDFCLIGQKGKMTIAVKAQLKNISTPLVTQEMEGFEAWLRIKSDGVTYDFEYSLDGKVYKPFYQVSCTLLSTEVVGGFTGAIIGMYAFQKGSDGATVAVFDYLKFEEQ
jgi:alpha-N-arabinofuranosidase